MSVIHIVQKANTVRTQADLTVYKTRASCARSDSGEMHLVRGGCRKSCANHPVSKYSTYWGVSTSTVRSSCPAIRHEHKLVL